MIGQALTDTPWSLKQEPVLPDGTYQFLLRNVNKGGEFYYEASTGSSSALYRTVISE